MASEILGNVAEKAKGLAGEKTGKMAQLAAVTKDVHDDKWRITSDYGVKQSNTDDWLKIATDDQTGPQLLEDQFAREKVHLIAPGQLQWGADSIRSIASITNVSPNASFTPVVPVLLENLPFSSRPQMSHRPASSTTHHARLQSSYGSRLYLVAVVLQTPSGMYAVSPSSSILKRETGTLSETTSQFSSSRIP